MSNRSTATNIDAARAKTHRAQADAADPAASVWVNANAGTGKTHVLTWRVLRLLLAGTKPERILCLTYTKAAAAEMSTRVFDTLAKWVTASDEALSKDLTDKLGRTPSAEELALARTLFTSAIETPGGLKVQTIHAFSERLLQRFPLEAGVAPGFKILDAERGDELITRAIDGTLREATGQPSSPLGCALHTAVRYVADASFDELLRKAVASRAWFDKASRLSLGEDDDDFAATERWLRDLFGVDAPATTDAVRAEMDAVLPHQTVVTLRDHLRGGTKSDIDNAAILSEVLGQQSIDARLDLLAKYFVSNRGKSDERARARLMTNPLAAARPDLRDAADRAAARFVALSTRLRSLSIIEASLALYRLAAGVLQRYASAKRTSGALDFDDLIAKTKSLLLGEGVADWVLFKLDGGLDHILVDEAQDTSPAQWQIISALTEEFFSGSSAREQVRSIFAVGDEKQSIYSFQGAVPERFAEFGVAFAARAASAELDWRHIPLRLSFRSVQTVLDAVDAVFSDHSTTPGLSASSEAISHIANRSGHAGLIEIWETEKARDASSADAWEPLADLSEQAPANRLAERIAETIRGWLDRNEQLASAGRPIRAGDILILVRKRNPFAVPMVAALKKRGIPVAGSDRIALTEQIAVQDLMALGDFLTLPEDDLQLATVLKGPLFNLTDDDLLRIATGRRGALWKALLAHAADDATLMPAAETLKRWRAKADFIPPFEFFSALLDRDGGRTKMLARLGPEAADAIDEFLDLALAYDDGAPPSLTGFLAQLRATARDVNRDMEHGRDEVRVMTVHGAKGLEAPIVFLPDTCSTSNGDAGPRLLELADAEGPVDAEECPIVWQIKQTAHVPVIATARQAKLQREREEMNRLLYVAMTRARDRLYVAGFERRTNGEGGKGRDEGCWYDLVHDALAASATTVTIAPDVAVKRIESKQSAEPEADRKTADAAVAPLTPPPFARTRVATEPRLSVPLQPSRLEPYAPDAEGEPLMRRERDAASPHDVPSPLAVGGEHRFLRGTLTHALLQHLPGIATGRRETVARDFIARRGAALSNHVQQSIVRETLAVLNDPGFAALFGPGSRAEVPVSAVLPRPRGRGPALELSGQIDRLAVTDSEVLIVDYKTNRPPPSDVARVADAYMFQLAAYALALQEIYPTRTIRAALLWTDGPRLMAVPQKHLAAYMTRLWDLDVASLDAT